MGMSDFSLSGKGREGKGRLMASRNESRRQTNESANVAPRYYLYLYPVGNVMCSMVAKRMNFRETEAKINRFSFMTEPACFIKSD